MKVLYTIVYILGNLVSAQNCSCEPNECCSSYGYCGNGPDYCGSGCQSGPCISNVVTDAFFKGIADGAGPNCPNRGFYTRSAFIAALASFPGFGTSASTLRGRWEIAAFFAHVTHETANLCFIEQSDKSKTYCDEALQRWPCAANKRYYGRGPLQLTWNVNYGAAGQAIRIDALKYPEIVATDAVVSFKTALWFWMENVHAAIISGQGFGATIMIIGGPIECNGSAKVDSRIDYYTSYCSQLGVDPGTNLHC